MRCLVGQMSSAYTHKILDQKSRLSKLHYGRSYIYIRGMRIRTFVRQCSSSQSWTFRFIFVGSAAWNDAGILDKGEEDESQKLVQDTPSSTSRTQLDLQQHTIALDHDVCCLHRTP